MKQKESILSNSILIMNKNFPSFHHETSKDWYDKFISFHLKFNLSLRHPNNAKTITEIAHRKAPGPSQW